MFSENTAQFLATADHAVAATYDGATTVNGIFDAAYLDGPGVAGTNPVFLCAAANVPVGGIGKTLLVNGVTYRIRNREPQDDGAFVLLQLEKQ